VDEVLPKLAVKRLLEPALVMPEVVRLVCLEDRAPALLTALAEHRIDVALMDRPVGAGSPIRAYSHLLGECGVSWFATPRLARSLRGPFPRCLASAPVLLPAPESALRRALDAWLERLDLHPRVVAEFEDSALLKAFGQDGIGAFPGPTALEREICQQYGVKRVGRTRDVCERFYAISVERRLKHPAVLAIRERARVAFHA
jgi:LysR family transcriptional activator of nhaA